LQHDIIVGKNGGKVDPFLSKSHSFLQSPFVQQDSNCSKNKIQKSREKKGRFESCKNINQGGFLGEESMISSYGTI